MTTIDIFITGVVHAVIFFTGCAIFVDAGVRIYAIRKNKRLEEDISSIRKDIESVKTDVKGFQPDNIASSAARYLEPNLDKLESTLTGMVDSRTRAGILVYLDSKRINITADPRRGL